MIINKEEQVFFALVRAGLWERGVSIAPWGNINYQYIYRIAEEQAVVGLVAAGLEHVLDVKVPQQWALQFAWQTIQLEQRNKGMNAFVAELFGKLRNQGIKVLLVKGQGVAQCYERPMWRSSGDVDLLLCDDNYNKARAFITPMATKCDYENVLRKHVAYNINNWTVELHGSLRSGLWKQLDKGIDEVQNDVFQASMGRIWIEGGTQIILPKADEDVIFVFSHIIQHFFKEGVGLRQICDWCRLLWTFHKEINLNILKRRICKMGIMTEWKVFAALSVNYLGMPENAMPFYDSSDIWERKSLRILNYIIQTGNFGHNRDNGYLKNSSVIKRKLITFWRRTKNLFHLIRVFPIDSLKVFFSYSFSGTMRYMKRG